MLCWKKKGVHHYIIIFVCRLNVAEKSIRCVINNIYYFAPPDFKHRQIIKPRPQGKEFREQWLMSTMWVRICSSQ